MIGRTLGSLAEPWDSPGTLSANHNEYLTIPKHKYSTLPQSFMKVKAAPSTCHAHSPLIRLVSALLRSRPIAKRIISGTSLTEFKLHSST